MRLGIEIFHYLDRIFIGEYPIVLKGYFFFCGQAATVRLAPIQTAPMHRVLKICSPILFDLERARGLNLRVDRRKESMGRNVQDTGVMHFEKRGWSSRSRTERIGSKRG